VLLGVPFVVALLLGRCLVPRLGDGIARRIAAASGLIAPPRRAPPPPPPPAVDGAEPSSPPRDEAAPPQDTNPRRDPAGGRAGKGVQRGVPADASADAQDAPVPRTIHVPAQAVQRAIDDGGKNIRGRTARGPDGKPAGVRLTGVSGAGVGLVDGDLIVAIDGAPALDEDTATDAALAAVARGNTSLHVTLLRRGQPIDATIDLPLAPQIPADGKAR